jgi:hypothetical protein
MALESKWNQLYLEQGIETFDMMQIDQELKEIRRQLRAQDAYKLREANFEEEVDITT